MTRVLLVIHRYLGVAIGLLMVLWCLSGFVMMYQGYPHLSEAERLRGLAPLQLPSAGAAAEYVTDEALAGFTLEMQARTPVLRIRRLSGDGSRGAQRLVALTTGGEIGSVGSATALEVATTFAAGNDIAGRPQDLGRIDYDQWTVEVARGNGPLHRLRFDDAAGTELYVAERTGLVTQLTTVRTRFWSWLGAIPHWLYPVQLRQHVALWDQIVVWTSLLGVFLTVTGAWVGIAHFHPRRAGRWTPFRGWFYWHHLAGLVFGLLVLTWVASGLFTMNPWGFLDTEVGIAERSQLSGPVSAAALKRFLVAAPRIARSGVVQLQSAPLNGQLFVMATTSDGAVRRFNADGVEQPLTTAELRDALSATEHRAGSASLATLERIDHEDAYYYSGYDGPVTLPAYRARLTDADATTYYIDAGSGQIVAAYDSVARQSRWLRTGLHDMDFTSGLRRRPLWDAVVLLLLTGVTAVCVTGAWMSLKRVKRDVLLLTRRCRARKPLID